MNWLNWARRLIDSWTDWTEPRYWLIQGTDWIEPGDWLKTEIKDITALETFVTSASSGHGGGFMNWLNWAMWRIRDTPLRFLRKLRARWRIFCYFLFIYHIYIWIYQSTYPPPCPELAEETKWSFSNAPVALFSVLCWNCFGALETLHFVSSASSGHGGGYKQINIYT